MPRQINSKTSDSVVICHSTSRENRTIQKTAIVSYSLKKKKKYLETQRQGRKERQILFTSVCHFPCIKWNREMFTNEMQSSRRRAPLRHSQLIQYPAQTALCRGDGGRCVTTKSTQHSGSFPINRGSVLRIKPIPVIEILFLNFYQKNKIKSIRLLVFKGKVIPLIQLILCRFLLRL